MFQYLGLHTIKGTLKGVGKQDKVLQNGNKKTIQKEFSDFTELSLILGIDEVV